MAKADSRVRVLRATIETLAAEGHAHTTARAIARTGGFAPGVIYYHFADLDDLFAAAAQYTSRARLSRYREQIGGVTSAVELVRQLRLLHAEDRTSGHIAAVQQLFAAAAPSQATARSRLAAQIQDEARQWRALAETVIHAMVTGTPFAAVIPVPELATAAVATYLGLELLPQPDEAGTDSLFDAAASAASLLEAFRRALPARPARSTAVPGADASMARWPPRAAEGGAGRRSQRDSSGGGRHAGRRAAPNWTKQAGWCRLWVSVPYWSPLLSVVTRPESGHSMAPLDRGAARPDIRHHDGMPRRRHGSSCPTARPLLIRSRASGVLSSARRSGWEQ
jgi:AcrR family transcriptional regulator